MENLKKNIKIQYLLKLHPPKKIIYLGISLTKEVKDLYAENYKTLIKEIKKDVKKFQLEKSYCKNGHITQSNLQIQCNPYPITHDIFHRTRTNNPKTYMESQETRIVKAILRNKNQA